MKLEKKIIDQATTNLGFEVKPTSIVATEVSVATEFMPFFNRTLQDESTWTNDETTVHIKFEDLTNITQRGGRPRFPNLESLSATLNPRTEQILKITSEWPANIPRIAPFPGALEEERQLVLKGERFVSLPANAPPVDFYNALKQLELVGPVSPGKAKQVMAYLVNHETVRYSARPVWIIQTRGIDIAAEGYAAAGGIPIDARNHMRHIIDAVTGEWLYSDTSPQPTSV
jgi:hypothetical protein